MESFIKDLRLALRLLAKRPGFTIVAVITLALGIGANTAIFSVINGLLLQPLPYKEPGRLVRITADLKRQNVKDVGLAVPELSDYRDRVGVFEDVSGIYPVNSNLTDIDEPERLEGVLVSTNYFSLLGVNAQLGRTFRPEDDQPSTSDVVVISDGLWKRRFGQDRNIIGRAIRLDTDLCTVIGVMPPGFHHPGRTLQSEAELWQATRYIGSSFAPPLRSIHQLSGALARLKPGVSIEVAQSRLNVVAEELRQENPKDYPAADGWTPRIVPLQDDLVGNVRPALLIMLGAVFFVLLIGCANVANLLLARATVRQRELSIRSALGASRVRLICQLLTESMVLAVVGGVLGLLLTLWTIDALVALLPADLLRVEKIGIDARVMAFTFGISILTSLIFGIAPALQATQSKIDKLKDLGRGMTAGAQRTRMRNLLVISEFALTLVLLIGAGLLIRSFWQLQKVDPGFKPDNVLTAKLWMPLPDNPQTGPYFKRSSQVNFYRQSIQRIAALPGVDAAGWVFRLPLSGHGSVIPFQVEGRTLNAAEIAGVEPNLASPDYFKAMRISLIRGRYFDEHDDETAPGSLIVSESFAHKVFPNEDPIGRRIKPGGQTSTAPWLTIVGVVSDLRSSTLETEPAPQMYRCVWQSPSLSMALVVRGRTNPSSLSAALSREIHAVDPNMPLFGIRTMSDIMAASLSQRRFSLILLGLFAGLALLLSMVGIYAVMAFLVQQRTHEIGIRMALGAGRADVLRLVLGKGLVLALAGVTLGLIVSVGLTRLMSSLLYAVSATDLATFLSVPALLVGVAIAACYIPAQRAMRVDPAEALRYE